MSISKSQERTYGAMLSYGSIIISFIAGFVATPIIIRCLGKSEYGVYTLVASLCAYLNIIEQGLADTVVKYFIKFKVEKALEKEQHFCAVILLVNAVLSVLICLIGSVLYVRMPNIYSSTMSVEEISIAQKLLVLMVLNLVVSFMFNLYQGILTASEKFIALRVTDIVNQIVSYSLIVAVLLLGGKSFSVVMITLVCNVVILLYKFLYCKIRLHTKEKWHKGVLNRDTYYELFKYLLAVLIVVIVEQIYWKLDNILISLYLGASFVAVYSIGMSFHKYLMKFATTISKVMTPKIFRDVLSGGSMSRVTDELIQISRIQALGIYLALGGLIAFGKEFVFLWVGSGYEEAYWIIIVTLIPYSFEIVGNIRNVILQANNLYIKKSLITLGISILNIILTVCFIKIWGIIGAAIGTGIGVILGQVGVNYLLYANKCCELMRYYKETYLKLIPVVVAMVILGKLIKNIIIPNNWGLFLINIGICTVFYLITCYIFVLNKTEKRRVINMLKRKKKCKLLV